MKIALVRGVHLNSFEFQLYGPLAQRHSLTAIGADWQFYPNPPLPSGIAVRHAHVLGGTLGKRFPGSVFSFHRVMSWTLGRSFALEDLDAQVQHTDVLHTAETYHSMTYQCLEIKRRRGIPLVVTVSENLPGRGERHPLRRKRKAAVLREADAFIAISEMTERMLQGEGIPPERIHRVPMSIDVARFTPGPRDPALCNPLRIGLKDRVLLFIGRLAPEKGIDDLLAVLPVLRRDIQALRVLIIGSGPLEPLVRRAEREFPETIRFLSHIPFEQIVLFHRLADVFVLPSRPLSWIAEQFGYVLAESMACAVPVVTTRTGAIPEVVGDGARLVQPNDRTALTTQIISLLKSDAERRALGLKGRHRVETHYNAVVNADQLDRVYRMISAC